ncbi:MAG: ABC transporter ATP-binding protein [Acidiphilium sp.]|nr:ABC transporter ATP-binding protein [Acidiphilium sp.]MDD4935285.1 ABC transporter ATP-binding protein [Acidiphilium sp.]
MAKLVLEKVEKRYETFHAIKGIDLTIDDREFVVFVGPSGCGKTTLLRMIAGLEEISGGVLSIDGMSANDIPADRRGLAMVFQTYALYPHMTVAENMGFALRMAKVPGREIAARVSRAAAMLQLGPVLERRPQALSGGQRQRVAIGRAIVRNPRGFLFDEPLSNLDAALRVQMRTELVKLNRQLQTTMIYVTHDQVEAMTMADRIVVLNGGIVEQVGRPLELYDNPANVFVAGFIGSPKINLLEGVVAENDGSCVRVRLDDAGVIGVVAPQASVAAGTRVTLGVRPEHVSFASRDPKGGDQIGGVADFVEHLGSETLVYVRRPDEGTMIVKVGDPSVVRRGDAVTMVPRADRALLFGPDGRALVRRPARGVS